MALVLAARVLGLSTDAAGLAQEFGVLPSRPVSVENAIRPFALGRKNWLFHVTPKGAQASARLYSLIETAKANGLDPYFYLRQVFIKLPQAKTLEDIETLLPWNLDPLSLIARSFPG